MQRQTIRTRNPNINRVVKLVILPMTAYKKISVAPHQRRGYQPHGSQWNVQVVRGKVTTRCLWNACKALTLGLLLLLLGCAMATVGQYF
ncbi:hypothetical protein L9F63_007690, partial [Diploptera punctata]